MKSVIRSKVRGVYGEINELFEGVADGEIRAKYRPVEKSLKVMRKLAAKLKADGEARGTMDLISTEAQFLLDEQGAPAAIFPRVTGEAEGMIEQFMIAANVAVAAPGAAAEAALRLPDSRESQPGKAGAADGCGPPAGAQNTPPTSEPAQTCCGS